MSHVSQQPNFHDNDIILDPYVQVPKIDENIGQDISYLMGWHNASRRWLKVNVDILGRVVVTNSGVASAAFIQEKVHLPSVETQILAPNTMRSGAIIQNQSANYAQIAFQPTIVATLGLILPAFATLNFDNYVGIVFGYSLLGTDVIVVEF
jgi:hypothetical protein